MAMCFSACVTVVAVMDLHCLHVLLSDAVYHNVSLLHPSASRQKDAELSTEVSTVLGGSGFDSRRGAFLCGYIDGCMD